MVSKFTWSGVLVAALKNLGGKAHLSRIYREAEPIRRECGGSITPQMEATIRKTLEVNSSDSDNYKGGPDLFWCPEGRGSGVWALR